jgi:hypothetical protein
MTMDDFKEFYEKNKKNIQVEKFSYEAHHSMQSWCNTSDGQRFDPDTCNIVKVSSWGGDKGAGIDGYCRRDEEKIECLKDYMLVIQYEEQSTHGGSRDSIDIDLFNANTKERLCSFCGSVSNWDICDRRNDSYIGYEYDKDEECSCLACRNEKDFDRIEDFLNLIENNDKLDTEFTNNLREIQNDL